MSYFWYVILGLFYIGVVVGLITIFWAFTLNIPSFDALAERKIEQSTKIYDRTGKILLYDIHKDIKRTVIPFEKIPRHMKNATVAIEDDTFYQHKGISLSSMLRAFIVNLKSGTIRQGGSTITQQLVKNAFLTPERTWTRKIKELILTLKMERAFSKEQILNLYLNEICYGANNYGVEAASQTYFGKHAEDLTLVESAYLAALPKAPTYYSPYGNHRDALEARKTLVLKRMLNLGFISEEEFESANNEKVYFISRANEGLKAPHFVMFIREYLINKYGEDVVARQGLKVITTLDWNLQQKAEEIVSQYVKENEEKFNAKNAGLVGIDPKTGQILVMVGSRDYFDIENEGNFNVTLARRQPGSAFKPFVYAAAIKKGFTPDTIVFDLETEFNSSCNPDGTPKPGINQDECYRPQNYDGVFRGPVTFREALAQSINVPSVKVLYLAGIKDSIQIAKDMGITTLSHPDRYGLTLVLGGGEVTLLELTGAYAVFANDGIKNPLTGILKIEDSNGNILEQFEPHPTQVLDSNVSRIITDMLSDNEARASAFGTHSWLYFPERPVAVKTGTTNDYRDAWIVGYTPNFALGAWAGNNDNSPMEKKIAGFIIAPLWNAFFKEVFKQLPVEEFPKPELKNTKKPILNGEWMGNITYLIDSISGKLATEFTPLELIEEKVLVQVHNILYWIDKNDPLGESPKDPSKDPQFNLWEKPVRDWVKNQRIKEQSIDDIPKEYDDVHKPEYQPKITIISPNVTTTYSIDERMVVRLSYESRFPLKQVDFFLNNSYLGSSTEPPFQFSFIPNNTYLIKNNQDKLRVIAYDEVGNKSEVGLVVRFR
ncbi:MAG: transglycosylase domain-containing protein [Promethearchaeota archaeon]